MNKLYKVAEKLSKKAIKDYGVEITFTHRGEASFDPVLGKKVAAITVYLGYGVKSNYLKKDIDGTVIKTGDIKILLENTETVPKVGDEAAINGSGSYRIMNIELISPAEETIIYKLQLRK